MKDKIYFHNLNGLRFIAALLVVICHIELNKKYFNLPVFAARFLGKIGDLLGNRAPINSLKVKKIISDLTFDDSNARRSLNWKPEPVLDYLKRESLD